MLAVLRDVLPDERREEVVRNGGAEKVAADHRGPAKQRGVSAKPAATLKSCQNKKKGADPLG